MEHRDVKTEISLVGAGDLVKKREALQKEIDREIADLLKEWSDLETATPLKILAIQEKLKSLGWKRPRRKNGTGAES